MNKKLATKWVNALRSGKFKQGKQHLLNEEGRYCCLGVLGTICKVPKTTLREMGALEDDLAVKCTIKTSLGTPSDDNKVKVQVGNTFKEFWSLAAANDSGASFRSIARWIEKNFKLL